MSGRSRRRGRDRAGGRGRGERGVSPAAVRGRDLHRRGAPRHGTGHRSGKEKRGRAYRGAGARDRHALCRAAEGGHPPRLRAAAASRHRRARHRQNDDHSGHTAPVRRYAARLPSRRAYRPRRQAHDRAHRPGGLHHPPSARRGVGRRGGRAHVPQKRERSAPLRRSHSRRMLDG